MDKTPFTAITPTRDRQEAFKLCYKFLTRQKTLPTQWIIVDDGNIPINKQYTIQPYITYIRREPSNEKNTLKKNILSALEQVKHNTVFIFEDDDWYSPDYFSFMLQHLKQYDLVGLGHHIDYLITHGRLLTHQNANHSSLCSTGFTRKVFDLIKDICSRDTSSPFIDTPLWAEFSGKKKIIIKNKPLVLGIKGLMGTKNTSFDYSLKAEHFPIEDKNLYILNKIIGKDIKLYSRLFGNKINYYEYFKN